MLRRPIRLTPRQREIVQHIWAGETGPQIANALQISPRTVDAHRMLLHAKYGTNTIAQLLKACLLDGVLQQGK